MKELIDVFQMEEIPTHAKIQVLLVMGEFINMQYGRNVSEAIVFELIKILDPENEKLKDKRFLKLAGVK